MLLKIKQIKELNIKIVFMCIKVFYNLDIFIINYNNIIIYNIKNMKSWFFNFNLSNFFNNLIMVSRI